MAAYLEACLEEANGDASLIAKPLATSPAPKACLKWLRMQGCPAKVFGLSGERKPRLRHHFTKVVGALGLKLRPNHSFLTI